MKNKFIMLRTAKNYPCVKCKKDKDLPKDVFFSKQGWLCDYHFDKYTQTGQFEQKTKLQTIRKFIDHVIGPE